MFASKADGPVDLHYGPGTVDLHTATNVILEVNGKKGQELPVLSFDIHYVIKRSGSRLAWTMVLDNRKSLTASPRPEPFYSVSFTTDAKGRNMADKVRHEVPGKDDQDLGEAVLSDIALPLEKVAVGDPSILLSANMLKSKDVEIILPESSPAYIYDGVKEINGRECYTFSYESKATVRQNGEEYPGSMRISTVFSKQMLPVSGANELTMNGPMENMVTKLVGSAREITAQDKAAAEEKSMSDLRTALKRAPLQQVTEPMAFRYVPASVRLKAESTLLVGKKGETGVNLPFLAYVMRIDTAEEAERMAWDVDVSALKLLGKPVKLKHALGFAFSTDEQGRDIRDFRDNTDLKVLTVADIQSDFIIPEGAYKSGDVCMPVKMKGKSGGTQYDFPEGQGFVFEGVKQVGSMRVGVFKADIDHFTARTVKTGAVRHGSLYIVRYYDLATMMPLWYDGRVVLDMENSTLTTFAGMTRIMN
ncbi:hypothetical protein [Pseudodesulfovibrio karagichevae]|uniref:Uncharacterized protein n=1 Tax=Pseudodesulfovibrio karagichevae TaxID=3239305 RepID=A0ABV4K1D2_9BACT